MSAFLVYTAGNNEVILYSGDNIDGKKHNDL